MLTECFRRSSTTLCVFKYLCPFSLTVTGMTSGFGDLFCGTVLICNLKSIVTSAGLDINSPCCLLVAYNTKQIAGKQPIRHIVQKRMLVTY